MITVESELLGIKDGEITLDAGCGNGRHSWEVCNRNHSSIVAFDIDAVSVKKNKYMLDSLTQQREVAGSYHLLVADVTKLPFKTGSFDKIICSEVLEHISEDRTAVEELVRVMSNDGAMGISVPHHLAESVCWKLSKDYYGFPGGHIRNYRTRQLLDLVHNAGLSVYAIRHKHALHSFYWIMRCVYGIKNERALVPAIYNKFLEWDLRTNRKPFRWAEGLLNRWCPKSVVIYTRKNRYILSE
jgi:ubiquinone/menaquinone biosynthesis C-methylase UbiE